MRQVVTFTSIRLAAMDFAPEETDCGITHGTGREARSEVAQSATAHEAVGHQRNANALQSERDRPLPFFASRVVGTLSGMPFKGCNRVHDG